MPYVLLICGKITTNTYTVQYAKTRIFISKFRSFLQKTTCFSTCFPKNHSRSNRSAAMLQYGYNCLNVV